jgi:hypothetical protein
MARRTTVSHTEFAATYPQLKARGTSDAAIARELGLSHMTVSRWKKALPVVGTDVARPAREAETAARIFEPPPERRAVVSSGFSRAVPVPDVPGSRIAALQQENELLKRLLAEHLLAKALARARSGH